MPNWITVAVGVVVVVLTAPTAEGAFVLFNTGVDASGDPLAGGAQDQHWKIIYPGPGASNPLPSVVLSDQKPGGYAQDAADARWVWLSSNGSSPGSVVFRLTFDLTGLDPTTATISGRWAADNDGTISLNGYGPSYWIGSGARSLSGSAPANYATFHSFTLDGGFVAGVNHLDIYVSDTGYPGGLIVTDLVGTATALPPPPPADPDPPVAAPAPAGLLLALTGAGCLGGFGWVRRRKPAAAA
jgi:hypothetical protein